MAAPSNVYYTFQELPLIINVYFLSIALLESASIARIDELQALSQSAALSCTVSKHAKHKPVRPHGFTASLQTSQPL